jgi:hypothetical protein
VKNSTERTLANFNTAVKVTVAFVPGMVDERFSQINEGSDESFEVMSDYLLIEILDHGIFMTKETVKEISVPQEKTNRLYSSNLSTVICIIKAIYGSLLVKSKFEGTVFTLKIPVSEIN